MFASISSHVSPDVIARWHMSTHRARFFGVSVPKPPTESDVAPMYVMHVPASTLSLIHRLSSFAMRRRVRAPWAHMCSPMVMSRKSSVYSHVQHGRAFSKPRCPSRRCSSSLKVSFCIGSHVDRIQSSMRSYHTRLRPLEMPTAILLEGRDPMVMTRGLTHMSAR